MSSEIGAPKMHEQLPTADHPAYLEDVAVNSKSRAQAQTWMQVLDKKAISCLQATEFGQEFQAPKIKLDQAVLTPQQNSDQQSSNNRWHPHPSVCEGDQSGSPTKWQNRETESSRGANSKGYYC